MKLRNIGTAVTVLASASFLFAAACSDDVSTETTTASGGGGTGATGGTGGVGANGGDGGTSTTGGSGGIGGSGGEGGSAMGGGGSGGMAPTDTVIVDFEAAPPTLIGFGGAEDSTVGTDPTDAANTVAQIVKSDVAELWAGTTVAYCPNDAIVTLPFSATEQSMSLRVWSPDANIPVRMKVENAGNPTVSVETEAMTTVASQWETLTFDFGNEAMGTAALDLGQTYDKVSVFFNFGTTGATAGAKTYYMDDITFLNQVFAKDCPMVSSAALDFEDPNTTYTLIGFGGAEQSTVVTDPTDAGNTVAQVIKSSTAELWAGTTTATGPNESIPVLPITANDTAMQVRVWVPVAGIPVRLKIEDANDPTHSVETEAMPTVSAGWETLTFDFANEAQGTAALNPAYTFNKVSIFFNFGTTGANGGGGTFYYDDIEMAP